MKLHQKEFRGTFLSPEGWRSLSCKSSWTLLYIQGICNSEWWRENADSTSPFSSWKGDHLCRSFPVLLCIIHCQAQRALSVFSLKFNSTCKHKCFSASLRGCFSAPAWLVLRLKFALTGTLSNGTKTDLVRFLCSFTRIFYKRIHW